ncbi:hypothetical protein COJ77_01555 [Bacillus cereus]|nr:hypothetical protein COJ77_01555 [Bacillus cereus]
MQFSFIILFTYHQTSPRYLRAVSLPPQNSAKTKKLGRESTARKCPIGSTNNQWGSILPTD